MAMNNIQEKISKYENFINNVLKEDLKKLDTHLQTINTEISDLIQQKQALKLVVNKNIHPEGFKAQVNLGCEYFMEAQVTDTSKLLMNIGLNHYLEFNIDEANIYLDARIKAFEKIAKEVRQKAAENKANIKYMLFGISEIQEHERKRK